MTPHLNTWIAVHSAVVLLAFAASLYFNTSAIVLTCGLVSILWYTSANLRRLRAFHPALGVPNLITLGRLSVLSVLVAFYGNMSGLLFILGILVVLVADGLDGFFARKLEQESRFGAMLDMETDAFLGILLAFIAFTEFDLGIWVPVAGAMRYAFVLVVRVLGWHEKQKVSVPWAKTIAVLFFVSLLTPFVLPWELARWATLISSVLIFTSFGVEIWLLANS